jgi:hypothetical protein
MSLSQCTKCFGYPLDRILADHMALDRACLCFPQEQIHEEDEDPDEEE